jgi:hypothetical protein
MKSVTSRSASNRATGRGGRRTGAQYEIRIDGTPSSYRHRKDYAMEAARLIKGENPTRTRRGNFVFLEPRAPKRVQRDDVSDARGSVPVG